MQQQIDSIQTVIFGTISSVIAFVFDIPVPTFFAALAGSIVAVGLSKSVTRAEGLVLILCGTLTSGFCVGMLSESNPGITGKAGAFILAFVVIAFREQIMSWLGRQVSEKLNSTTSQGEQK